MRVGQKCHFPLTGLLASSSASPKFPCLRQLPKTQPTQAAMAFLELVLQTLVPFSVVLTEHKRKTEIHVRGPKSLVGIDRRVACGVGKTKEINEIHVGRSKFLVGMGVLDGKDKEKRNPCWGSKSRRDGGVGVGTLFRLALRGKQRQTEIHVGGPKPLAGMGVSFLKLASSSAWFRGKTKGTPKSGLEAHVFVLDTAP